MTILHFRNRRYKRSERKPAAQSKAPIELAGLSTNGQSTTLYLRRGPERRQVALGDDHLLNFSQRARQAVWNAAPPTSSCTTECDVLPPRQKVEAVNV